ncbi:MAG: 23S rRNA (adenine(1618)-N(6))-methyltransferase RlmF [Bacteroidetes bacterium]|uniref:23S rRNA (adenine(1618)-N(6))-methyltransferase RlmF n=1 Tax=Flavobacterium sp. TaxID=239 RepID=UPI002FDA1ED0|nr:23S rRNA (adenine(1618)-N(6))-methyltransferase RlmF [Bacteroidota bacterium]
MKKIQNTDSEKSNFHLRNPHRFRYDFDQLIIDSPKLKQFVLVNEHDNQSIDFSNPEAVKALNNAILISEYDIQNWDIPKGYLCPPIPGRADYIHYIADLLASSNNEIIPKGEMVIGLDVGIGANCIYPIIGNAAYDWSFVGCDIDENALQNCKKIIANNPKLIDAISLQLQTEPRFIFKNIILPEDKFAFTICNPPFHNSVEDANKAALRKVNNLLQTKTDKAILNFGGQQHELWCAGGEFGFITQMIYESVKYPLQVFWFTTLVSKKDNLKSIYRLLNKVGAVEIKTIDMAQGQKISRMVAWTFLSEDQQKNWKFSE